MKLDNVDEGLTALAVRRRLLTPASASQALADRGHRSVAVALVEDGYLTVDQVRTLREEQRANSIPISLDGYRITAHLGNGGMSVVFKATETATGREVALKLLSPRVDGRQSAPRFMRETRAVSAVHHPNVIRCFGHGMVNGRPYQVLEYMAGGDVQALLRRCGGRLPEKRALAIARDCAEGLAAIHAAGLLHRDVKPSNIFLDGAGLAKLADLGLARAVESDEQLTLPGHRVGTPTYMSPEQASGRPDVDARTDLYGLGATLYHMVTGRPPFSGGSVREVVLQVLHDNPEDPRRLCSELRPSTCQIIAMALAKRREDRYEDASRLCADLESALNRSGERLPSSRRNLSLRRRIGELLRRTRGRVQSLLQRLRRAVRRPTPLTSADAAR